MYWNSRCLIAAPARARYCPSPCRLVADSILTVRFRRFCYIKRWFVQGSAESARLQRSSPHKNTNSTGALFSQFHLRNCMHAVLVTQYAPSGLFQQLLQTNIWRLSHLVSAACIASNSARSRQAMNYNEKDPEGWLQLIYFTAALIILVGRSNNTH